MSGRTLVGSFRKRETVAVETPAERATSRTPGKRWPSWEGASEGVEEPSRRWRGVFIFISTNEKRPATL
jgi:hypothetical protein